MRSLVVAIDMGNTSIKIMGFQSDGRAVHGVRIPTDILRNRKYTVASHEVMNTLDVDALWTAICSGLRNFVAGVNLVDEYSIVGIAVTGMGGPLVAIDREGNSLYPLLGGWGIPTESAVTRYIPKDVFYRITGYQPHSIIATVAWLHQNDTERFSRVAKLLPIESFIGYRLTGIMLADPSTAGSSGGWDHASSTWAWSVLRDLKLPRELFPDVAPSESRLGHLSKDLAHQLNLPSGISVAVGGHDYLCAATALNVVNTGNYLDMLGTFEILSVIKEIDRTGLQYPDGLDLIVDSHVYPGMLSYMFQLVAGRQLEWLKNVLLSVTNEEAWLRLNNEALQLDDSTMGDLTVAPFIGGRLFPERCTYSLGAFLGMSPQHDARHLLRAMVDSLNFVSLEALNTLTHVVDDTPKKIFVTGGGIRNPLWLQRKADFFDMPLIVPEIPDATALGAAMLAGVAAGVYPKLDDAIASVTYPIKVVKPQHPPSSPYLDRFLQWDANAGFACSHTRSTSTRIVQEVIGHRRQSSR